MLNPGDPAPDFSLPSTNGKVFTLSSLKGKRNIVLYFYPKDNTPGCTAEAKGFTAKLQAFKDLEAEVLGVSRDSLESHSRFASLCSLSFTLLSDGGGKVAHLYGASGLLGLTTRRITYVIDKEGNIRHVCSSLLPSKHVSESLEALEGLRQG